MSIPEVSALLSHTDSLFRYGMALSRNVAAAEDLVQETILRALSAKRPPEPGSNHKSWLFTILRNIWLNELRKGRWISQSLDAEPGEAALDTPAATDGDPHRHYISKLEVSQVRDAIQQLPTEFREIVMLREYEDLSYQEIAEFLKCPVGTVMSRLARARSRLRTILSAQQATASR
ncbi:MAG TPA: RNA polymerase sigma factor [Alloacidobacterium sp.]|nr:RNA polymerase sigma factor [Alloacidobacterium sp.]